ncbi:hypothetical protein PHMEG_00030608 [Phytophthora megakarya]|uniref:WRKY19-like zinc finger domain-containing protein n=1 Tax=Phytophthora megakarya TaxID=4795 RepID=A0A225UZX8_9STRA|nr:hypothetical protein PHMEG_00030608 [Phytophthora megakarya]
MTLMTTPKKTNQVDEPIVSSLSGRQRCSIYDYNRQVQSRKLCKAHGGGVSCRSLNCGKLAQRRGLCVAHGGGRYCEFGGCVKFAQFNRFCVKHGGGRRCNVRECQKFAQIRGFCKAHAKDVMGNSVVPVVSRCIPSFASQYGAFQPVSSLKDRTEAQKKRTTRQPEPASRMDTSSRLSLVSQDPALQDQ